MKSFLKVSAIVFLFTLIVNNAFSQRSSFSDFPIKGKIKAYEIVMLQGDSANSKEKLLEKKTYNKSGIALTTLIYDNDASYINYQEKTIERDGAYITYQCQCSKIDDFIKYFKFKNASEKLPHLGGAVAEPPNRFVTVKTFDGSNNIIKAERYTQEGYQLTRTLYKYTKQHRLANKITYNDDDSIVYREQHVYDKNGNLTEQVIKAKDYPYDVSEYFKYNAQNDLISHLKYDKENLSFHYEYSISENNNQKSIIEIDKLKGDTISEVQVYYDTKHREVKRTSTARYGMASNRIESDYYDRDILKSKTYFRNDTMLYQHISFANNKNNNWIKMERYQLVTTIKNKEETTGIRQSVYLQKIDW